jgi:hypothetical protein
MVSARVNAFTPVICGKFPAAGWQGIFLTGAGILLAGAAKFSMLQGIYGA